MAPSDRWRAGLCVRLLEQTLQQIHANRVEGWPSRILANLGEAYLLAGRGCEASETAGVGLELSRKHMERGHEAWCLRLLGEIASRGGRPKDAEIHLREAIALAAALGMRPLLAHCHLGLARLYRDTGDRAAAAEEDATAVRAGLRLGFPMQIPLVQFPLDNFLRWQWPRVGGTWRMPR